MSNHVKYNFMKVRKEKNVQIFNDDAKNHSGYLYTSDQIYSAKIATKKQTEEIVLLIKKFFPKKIKILDIGCGDGKHTTELLKLISPNLIIGVDPAKEAIKVAKERITNLYAGKLKFRVGDIYNLEKIFKKGQFDLAILRGVLHHLSDPLNAIQHISKIFPSVIVIEANGYNPILKIIEKVSPYHRDHEEKSYWPPSLNRWFAQYGYKIKSERHFGIVPYFCPRNLAKFLKFVEPFFENIPLFNKLYTACNIIYYQK